MNKVSIIIAMSISTVALVACQENEEAGPQAPRPVLSTVAREIPAQSLRLAGTVQAKTETELGFRVLGRIIARNVGVGDLVTKGDIVAAIDPLSLELAVRSAQSDLANAQAQLRNAQSTEQRQRTLAESRSGTEAALEEAEQGRRSAVASVARAQANLEKAEEQLSYAQLRAEFKGVVTETSAEVGQVVSAGQVVVTIARPEERDAVVDVPQAAAADLKTGTRFDVTLQSEDSVRVAGVAREIAPQAESGTRTRRTKIGLVNPPSEFRLGAVVTASATVSAEPRIILPGSSIVKTEDSTSVWVVDVDSRKVVRRTVRLADDPGPADTVILAEGVEPGERIVIAGVNRLHDGQSIRIDQEVSQ